MWNMSMKDARLTLEIKMREEFLSRRKLSQNLGIFGCIMRSFTCHDHT